jgi:iron complex transport system substrate-binding protein
VSTDLLERPSLFVLPIEDAATRREFIIGAAALGFLAACGGDDSSDAGATDSGSGTRSVEGAYGPIDIPVAPKRIMADLMTVDYLTALGYDTSTIIGVFEAGYFKAADDHYLADFFAGQEVLDPGSSYEMNLEAIAAAKPDLILVPFDQIDRAPQREELAQIAPLLAVPTSKPGDDPKIRYGGTASFQDWRSTLRKYGELLDLSDAAEDYITETEGQLAAISAEHGALIASITATEAKSMPDFVAINSLSPARTTGVLGTILMSELGFQAPPQQAAVTPDEYGTIEISGENTDLLDGDVLFLEVRERTKRHEESPIWATLEVVKAGNVTIVGNHWEYGGAIAARDVIADIEAALDAYAAKQ